ncbi:small multi-drug resistant family protein [Sphingomonas sp. So64.6b]|uniref:small multi-drug resistant family protein n=1 Tax=Sphingomonas sp. So64.6b TaxID=2997354 RepID=UPI00160339B1|nr:small multi-drug resistant family protein [Sphingomonas sp. So64.6b]QNA83644.1 small multi-drug resistant family protein [Sphingomonas sp. So64.6b]
MKTTDLVLILGSVVLSATAQFLLKLGASAPAVRAALGGDGAFEARAIALITTPTLIGGLAVYALSAGFWIAVLSRVDLSLAYPFVGLGFVFTFLIGTVFLGETANAARLSGTLLIMAGAVLVARSG